MPKKPRKIRVGSSAWSEQRTRDKAAYDTQKAAEKPKSKPKAKPKPTDWYQSQKPRTHYYEQQSKAPTFQSAATIANLRTLGLTAKQNTLAEIKRAYRLLALKYHPDKNKDPNALGLMKTINVAFAQLIGKDLD